MPEIYDISSRVERKELVNEGMYLLTLEAPEIASSVRPGQFVQLGYEGQNTLLRRPFSVAWVWEDLVFLLIKIRGPFTRYLYENTPKEVKLLGPLGNTFPVPKTDELHLIAGGMGVAPLLFAAGFYKETHPVKIWYGVKCDEDAFDCQNLPGEHPQSWQIINEENEGMITDFLTPDKVDDQKTYFICGPPKMMVKIADILYNIPESYYSLETMMGCGLGICLGCTLPMKKGNRRVCVDGPVFKGIDICWSEYV